MWWDTRILKEPIEILVLNLSKNEDGNEQEWTSWARSHGINCIDYNSSIPIRFMVLTKNTILTYSIIGL